MELGKHRKEYQEVVCLSMYLLDIIRMEREGVEKTGVQCLMSGVQGMEIRGGKPKILKSGGEAK